MSGIVGGVNTGSGTGIIFDHISRQEVGIGKHNFLQRGGTLAGTTSGEPGYYPQQILWEIAQGGGSIDEDYTYYTPDGINLGVTGGYAGISSSKKYRYMQLEATIRGWEGTNHQGMFWGNAQLNHVGEGGSTTGFKSTHQSGSIYCIRGINQNNTQASFNPGYSPDDNIARHHMVWCHTNGNMYYYIDGVERFNSSSFAAPAGGGYCGFLAYAGTKQMMISNIRLRSYD